MFGWFRKQEPAGAPIHRVNGQQARALVAEGAALVDVRTPAENKARAIPGSRNIPLADLPRRLGELEPGAKVIVYCRSGARSARAAGLLAAAGFTAVHDLGGIDNW